MDSSFVNYDGRSVHDMIEALLAMSGDPEAIRRLQESINSVDQRAQSSIAVVNTAVELLDEDVAALNTTGGVKNIVPNEGHDTFEQSGITFTKNADGSVTANGTATSTAIYRMKENFTIPRGKYIITGSPSGVADDKFFVQLHKQGVVTHRDTGNPAFPQEWDETGKTVYDWYGIGFLAGTVADNLVFYPMIRPQGTDAEYVEGMYPNSEFTDTGWNVLENTSIKYRKKNGFISYNLAVGATDYSFTSGSWTQLGTMPVGFRPKVDTMTAFWYRKTSSNQFSQMLCQLVVDGRIQVYGSETISNNDINSILLSITFPE